MKIIFIVVLVCTSVLYASESEKFLTNERPLYGCWEKIIPSTELKKSNQKTHIYFHIAENGHLSVMTKTSDERPSCSGMKKAFKILPKMMSWKVDYSVIDGNKKVVSSFNITDKRAPGVIEKYFVLSIPEKFIKQAKVSLPEARPNDLILVSAQNKHMVIHLRALN